MWCFYYKITTTSSITIFMLFTVVTVNNFKHYSLLIRRLSTPDPIFKCVSLSQNFLNKFSTSSNFHISIQIWFANSDKSWSKKLPPRKQIWFKSFPWRKSTKRLQIHTAHVLHNFLSLVVKIICNCRNDENFLSFWLTWTAIFYVMWIEKLNQSHVKQLNDLNPATWIHKLWSWIFKIGL